MSDSFEFYSYSIVQNADKSEGAFSNYFSLLHPLKMRLFGNGKF